MWWPRWRRRCCCNGAATDDALDPEVGRGGRNNKYNGNAGERAAAKAASAAVPFAAAAGCRADCCCRRHHRRCACILHLIQLDKRSRLLLLTAAGLSNWCLPKFVVIIECGRSGPRLVAERRHPELAVVVERGDRRPHVLCLLRACTGVRLPHVGRNALGIPGPRDFLSICCPSSGPRKLEV